MAKNEKPIGKMTLNDLVKALDTSKRVEPIITNISKMGKNYRIIYVPKKRWDDYKVGDKVMVYKKGVK